MPLGLDRVMWCDGHTTNQDKEQRKKIRFGEKVASSVRALEFGEVTASRLAIPGGHLDILVWG